MKNDNTVDTKRLSFLAQLHIQHAATEAWSGSDLTLEMAKLAEQAVNEVLRLRAIVAFGKPQPAGRAAMEEARE